MSVQNTVIKSQIKVATRQHIRGMQVLQRAVLIVIVLLMMHGVLH